MATLIPAKYGKVVGRLMAVVGDGPDEDEYPLAGGFPDAVPLTGTVTFTPRATVVLVPGAQPAPVTAFATPIVAQLDQNGYLTLNGKRGVFLLCPSVETNPPMFSYSVRYDLRLNGRPISSAPFDMELVEYAPGPDPLNPDAGSTAVDLTLVTPVYPATGTPVVRGPAGDSVTAVTLSEDQSALVFHIAQGDSVLEKPVTIPAFPVISDAMSFAAVSGAAATVATQKAEAAAGSAVAAAASAQEAATYVGGVADNTITSAKIVDGSIVDVDVNADAGIAQSKIAGLVDDLGGKAPAVHTHTAISITDASAVGRTVLTAADKAAARAAIDAGTSSLTLGVDAGTACAGNDSRLSNQRTPSDNSVTSAKIVDGTIVNADINANAAIALSKLAAGYVQGQRNGVATTTKTDVLTEAQFAALGTKDPATIYFRTA